MIDWLKGKKTYLVAAGLAVATFAKAAGIIDETLYQVIVGLLAPAGLASMAAKVNRVTQ